MKGNRTLKKYLALAMAVVFVVSGIIFTPKSTSAAAPDATWNLIPNGWNSISNGWSGLGNGGAYERANADDNEAVDIYVDNAPADWGVQLRSADVDFALADRDKPYNLILTFEADKAGSFFAKEDITATGYQSYSYTASSSNVITIPFTSAAQARILINMVGVAADTTFTGFKVTYSERITTTAETTTRGDTEGNIIENNSTKWHMWSEPEGWDNYDVGTVGHAEYGYAVTNKDIGSNWYSIQTSMDNVSFTANKEYTFAFKLTTSEPKSFIVDNRIDTGSSFPTSGTIFTETADSIARGWVNNGDSTYTYFYEGTYSNTTSSATIGHVRISWGYNASNTTNAAGGETDTSLDNFDSGDTISVTVSDVIITPTAEYNPGDGYNDCTGSGAQYQANGWGYDRLGNSMGFRTGAYDGYEYVMELKNRESSSANAEVISSQFGDAQEPCVEEGKTYRYTLTVRNNAESAITAQIGGFYYSTSVLPLTTAETVNATSSKVITGTFTSPATQYGRFQIKLNNIPAGGEVGVISLTIEEVSPWQLVSTYGSFTSMGDWEYYVDSHGEGYYDSNLNPNTYDNVGFKYVAKDSGSGSNNYRLRTSVLSDTTGRFNTGDYYDYSFTLAIDDDSEDSLPNAHIKVVEFTGDGVDDYLFLKDVPAVAVGGSTDITGTCGATVNGSRIGIVVDTEDDIALHITDFEVTRRGSEEGILKSSKIAIEGFQIRTNDALASINYRTMCKAPNIGSKITVDGTEYTIDSLGTSYALDTNYDGNDAHNNLDASYTILDPTPVSSSNPKYQGVKPYAGQNRTHGYIASSEAIIPDWKEGDTANTYYAFTMQGMDDIACYTIWVRPFVKTTTGELIYGNTTAFTSVAEIASHLYTNSLAKNISSHNYLYNSIVHNTSIVPTTNPYYQAEEVVYGWSNTLFIGYRLIPDEWDGAAGGLKEEMQYVSIEDWLIHANSAYGGAQGSYKGVNNDEICVRVDQPGNGFEDEWHNWLNWGIQIRLPNRAAYKRLENGKTYDMTIAYKTNKDGLMRVKCEANTDILTKYQDNPTHSNPGTYTKPGYHEDGIGQYPATTGYNYITERFTYYDRIIHGQNEASIVLMPCPSQGDVEGNGFPAGTIISNISVTFEEVSN